MKRLTLFALFLLFVLGACGREVDSRAVPYVDAFKQEAINRGVAVNVLSTSIVVDPNFNEPGKAAVCDWGTFGKTIRLGPNVPLDGEYRLSVEAVIFHELGHCVLTKDHVETDSIMNATTPIHTYAGKRTEYLDEFFSN